MDIFRRIYKCLQVINNNITNRDMIIFQKPNFQSPYFHKPKLLSHLKKDIQSKLGKNTKVSKFT